VRRITQARVSRAPGTGQWLILRLVMGRLRAGAGEENTRSGFAAGAVPAKADPANPALGLLGRTTGSADGKVSCRTGSTAFLDSAAGVARSAESWLPGTSRRIPSPAATTPPIAKGNLVGTCAIFSSLNDRSRYVR